MKDVQVFNKWKAVQSKLTRSNYIEEVKSESFYGWELDIEILKLTTYEGNKLTKCSLASMRGLECWTETDSFRSKMYEIKAESGGSRPSSMQQKRIVFLTSCFTISLWAWAKAVSYYVRLQKLWIINCVLSVAGYHSNTYTWQVLNPVMNGYHTKFKPGNSDWFQKIRFMHSSRPKMSFKNFIIL